MRSKIAVAWTVAIITAGIGLPATISAGARQYSPVSASRRLADTDAATAPAMSRERLLHTDRVVGMFA